MNWYNAHFLFSIFTSEDMQKKSPVLQEKPQLALVGRSNVGKSSLINHLLNNKSLAKVSSTPGKTQSVNIFNIDNAFLMVDLPGYGFAKAPKESQKVWKHLIESYLYLPKKEFLLCLLIDSRRDIDKNDLLFIDWCKTQKHRLLVIYTKADKLSQQHLRKQVQNNQRTITNCFGEEVSFLTHSLFDKEGKTVLRSFINQLLLSKE